MSLEWWGKLCNFQINVHNSCRKLEFVGISFKVVCTKLKVEYTQNTKKLICDDIKIGFIY